MREKKGATITHLRPADGRMPPNDLAAEAAVLSAILLSTEAFDRVQEFLDPTHFYADANRRVYEAAVSLHNDGRPVDIVTVRSWLKDKQRLEQVGGAAYLVQLTDAVPSVANIEEYAKIVRSKWRVRQLIATCQTYAAQGYGDFGDAQEFIDRAEQSVYEIARVPEGSVVEPIKRVLARAYDAITETARRGGVSGVATGFTDLDKKIDGLQRGDLYIIAARPGMGKTAFVMNAAVMAAAPIRVDGSDQEEPGHGVAVFSLEMPREQLASRMIASEARFDGNRLRAGMIGKGEWEKLANASQRLGTLPIWIDDTPAITLMDLRARVRRLKSEVSRGSEPPARNLSVVIVDYLQLMQGRKDAHSREQEISELSRGLKQLAKELDVAVVALSQLNRAVETRSSVNKRPQLSDLRESGAIEQDADAVIFIYREAYYEADVTDPTAEIIIAKQRSGPTGTVRLRFTSECTRFDNLAPDEYDFDDFNP